MAVHKGTIEVEGTAPNALTWRLGVRGDGEALLTVGPGEKVQQRGGLRRGTALGGLVALNSNQEFPVLASEPEPTFYIPFEESALEVCTDLRYDNL